MDPGNTDIIQADYFIAKDLRSQRRFFSNRNVTCSSGRNHDPADPVRNRHAANDPDTGVFMIVKFIVLCDKSRLFRRDTSDQDRFIAFFFQHLHDSADLFRCFSCAIYHLCCALADLAVVVDHRITEIRERFLFDLEQSVIDSDLTVPDTLQHSFDLCIHATFPSFPVLPGLQIKQHRLIMLFQFLNDTLPVCKNKRKLPFRHLQPGISIQIPDTKICQAQFE